MLNVSNATKKNITGYGDRKCLRERGYNFNRMVTEALTKKWKFKDWKERRK